MVFGRLGLEWFEQVGLELKWLGIGVWGVGIGVGVVLGVGVGVRWFLRNFERFWEF